MRRVIPGNHLNWYQQLKTNKRKYIKRQNIFAVDTEKATDCLIKVSCHEELACGILRHANAAAFTMKSFTDSLTLSFFNIAFRSARTLSHVRQLMIYTNKLRQTCHTLYITTTKFLSVQAVYAMSPQTVTNRLQRVMNAATQVVIDTI